MFLQFALLVDTNGHFIKIVLFELRRCLPESLKNLKINQKAKIRAYFTKHFKTI